MRCVISVLSPGGSAAGDGSILDTKKLRSAAERPEQRFIGSGHPGLGADFKQGFEKMPAPLAIEMRNHFVQQQDWRCATLGGDEAGMRKHESNQKRLLFAGRSLLGRDTFLTMDHLEVASMRAWRRWAEGRARGSQCGAKF